MWKLLAIVLLATAVLSYDRKFWKDIYDFEAVSNVDFGQPIKRASGDEEERVLTISKGDGTKLIFSCIKHSPYSIGAQIVVENGSGNKTYYPAPTNAYKAIGDNHYDLRFIDHEDGSISGSFIINNIEIAIEPVSHHKRFFSDHHTSKLSGASHVLFRENRTISNPWKCGICGDDHANITAKRSIRRARRHNKRSLLQFASGNTLPFNPPPNPCPRNRRELHFVFVLNTGFYGRIGSNVNTATNYVTTSVNVVNRFFPTDFNIRIAIDEIIIRQTKVAGDAWDVTRNNCNGANLLTSFGSWKQSNRPAESVAYLHHDCLRQTNGVITLGSAYVGAMCNSRFSAGESMWLANQFQRNRVLGHEIGHIVGCTHNSVGIMLAGDPGVDDSRYERFSRASQAEGCGVIGSQGSCLTGVTNPKTNIFTLRKSNRMSHALDGGNGGANNRNMKLYSYSASNVNQHWIQISRPGGFFSFQKRNTNFCLDGGNGGARSQNVKLYACGANNQNQHWKKINRGGNKFRLEKRNAPGFSIDGDNGGTNNQLVLLWNSANSNGNQQWEFTNVV